MVACKNVAFFSIKFLAYFKSVIIFVPTMRSQLFVSLVIIMQ